MSTTVGGQDRPHVDVDRAAVTVWRLAVGDADVGQRHARVARQVAAATPSHPACERAAVDLTVVDEVLDVALVLAPFRRSGPRSTTR